MFAGFDNPNDVYLFTLKKTFMGKYLFLLAMLSAYCLSGSAQSQTKTANLFNCWGQAALDLWLQKGTEYVSADDGSYAYSKKLSSGRGTLQLPHPLCMECDG